MIRAHGLIETMRAGFQERQYHAEPESQFWPEQLRRAALLRDLSKIIESAEKFDFSDTIISEIRGTDPLYQTAKEYLEAGLLRLPFDNFYAEGEIEIRAHRTILDESGRISADPNYETLQGIHAIYAEPASAELMKERGWMVVFEYFIRAEGQWSDPGVYGYLDRYSMVHCCSTIPQEAYADYPAFIESFACGASFLMCALAMLDAKGVALVREEAPAKLNKHRIARGRPPLYSHHVIKIGGISRSGRIIPLGHQHASPRMHWRRGHLRHIVDKIIPVRACLVGDASLGRVTHDYEITKR